MKIAMPNLRYRQKHFKWFSYPEHISMQLLYITRNYSWCVPLFEVIEDVDTIMIVPEIDNPFKQNIH